MNNLKVVPGTGDDDDDDDDDEVHSVASSSIHSAIEVKSSCNRFN
jgi:hypothetical protein